MSPFTVEAAAALDGPDWLRARRAGAAERFASSSLPSTDEEVWRYSRVDELDLDQFALTGVPGGGGGVSPLNTLSPAATVTVVDGTVVDAEVDPGWAAKGLVAGRLADLDDGPELLGSVASEPPDVFALMNDAFLADPVAVRVPRGLAVDAPVVITNHGATDASATFPRLVVRAGENSQVTVVDHYSSTDVGMLVVPLVELDAGPAARLAYVGVQDLGPRAWQIGSQVSRVGQDATLTSATAGLGGDYARLRTDCRLDGRGATGDLLAVYFGEDHQTLDFRTFQDHRAPDTTSTLLFKGAVSGHSRSVYTGLIRVRKDARGTNAFQTNRNIKLSDHAWAESVPNLEIENNDVRCSHASAVGPIDEEQRFYLESRGVRPALAERLVVAGFFEEVLALFPAEGVAEPVTARISAKLDRAGELG